MPPPLSNGFKAPHAVIDFVEFIVELARKTQGSYLKRRYEGVGVSFAHPLDKAAGGAASKFLVRLQHPVSFDTISCLLSALDHRYGLITIPTVKKLEVSIDFFHHDADVAAIRAMTERLMNSIVPPVIANPRAYGGSFDPSDGQLPSRGTKLSADKTLYIGDKDDDLMWRVYWKRTDETYLREDGRRIAKPLPCEHWRARAEICMQGHALKKLGLVHVSDLENFAYERLHSAGFFKFARRIADSLPLFTTPWALASARSLGNPDTWPACAINQFGRRDRRNRVRQLNHQLVTDLELTEASRQALRNLTRRFNRRARAQPSKARTHLPASATVPKPEIRA